MSDTMDRRQFIGKVFAAGVTGQLAAGAVCTAGQSATQPASDSIAPAKRAPTDRVAWGKTGVKVSRVGMGTGMKGWNHASNQTRLGKEGFTRLFRHVYDQGITHFDCADMYGSHEYIKAAMKGIPRDKITILSKTVSHDAEGVRKDLERFRKELGVDYIDAVLLHCMTDADWTQKMKGPMDVLSEAQQKGQIRAHGVSCHTLAALKLASETDWVQVDLARINPRGVVMDGKPDEVLSVLQKFHARGAGVIGMKIVGEGRFKDDATREESLRFVLSQSCVDAFIIGFEKPEEVNDALKRCRAILA